MTATPSAAATPKNRRRERGATASSIAKTGAGAKNGTGAGAENGTAGAMGNGPSTS